MEFNAEAADSVTSEPSFPQSDKKVSAMTRQTRWSRKKGAGVLPWPGQSPDLDSRPVITHVQPPPPAAPRANIPEWAFQLDLLQCSCFPVSLFPLLFIWHCSPDTVRVAAIRRRQSHRQDAPHRDPRRIWHPIYLKHLFSWVNDPTKGPASEGWGGVGAVVQHSGEIERLNLTSGPRSRSKFGASCPNRSGFSCWKHLIHLLDFCSSSPPHDCPRLFYSQTRAAWHRSHLWRPSIFKGECRWPTEGCGEGAISSALRPLAQRESSITRLSEISSNYSHVIYTMPDELTGLNVGGRDDACCRRTKDGPGGTWSDDKRVRMTIRIAISLWTQQATPAQSPITHAFVFGVTQVETGRWKFNRDAKKSKLNAEWVLSIGYN